MLLIVCEANHTLGETKRLLTTRLQCMLCSLNARSEPFSSRISASQTSKSSHMKNDLLTISQKIQTKQFGAAAKLALRCSKKAPKNPDFPKLAGFAYHKMGKHSEAVKHLARAAKLAPADRDIHENLVMSLLELDHVEKAEAVVDRWLVTFPDNAELWCLKATCGLAGENFPSAIESATEALKLRPNMKKALIYRGVARFELTDFSTALDDFEEARKSDPHNPDILINIGSTLGELHRFSESIEVFEQAVRSDPSNAEFRFNLGQFLMEQGDFERAKEQFRAALRIYPGYFEAFQQLVESRNENETERLKISGLEQLADPEISDDARTSLEISMASLLLGQGDIAEAKDYLERSNRRRAITHPFDVAMEEDHFAKTVEFFSKSKGLRPGGNTKLPVPIFVVGLPRSGTTLTELVLSAHSRIAGLGEYGDIDPVARGALSGDGSGPAEHAEFYARGMPELPDGTMAFVDKMPANYVYIGFLLEAFPEARFINVERDPREVAFSMWQKHLRGKGTYYTSRMDWMAFAANLYKKYMAFWKSLYPDKILDISYREMVSDVEGTSRKLAEFCDLTWEPAMAKPEKNSANVKTASIRQIRSGVHKGSLGKWRAFEDVLQPFVDDLDPELWPDLEP